MQRAVVMDQAVDAVVQVAHIAAHDAGDRLLLGVERAGHAFGQQVHALFHRGQRGFELVRHMPQQLDFLRLQIGQPAAQPVELHAQIDQIARPSHAGRLIELPFAQTADGAFDLSQGLAEQPGEQQRQTDRQAHAGQRQPAQHRPHAVGDLQQPRFQRIDQAVAVVDQPVGRQAHGVELRVERVEHPSAILHLARGHDPGKQRRFLRVQAVEGVLLVGRQRHGLELRGIVHESLMRLLHPAAQRGVLQHQTLAAGPLQVVDVLGDLARGARELHRHGHRAARLRGHLIEQIRRDRQPDEQRQPHQRKAPQQQRGKRDAERRAQLEGHGGFVRDSCVLCQTP